MIPKDVLKQYAKNFQIGPVFAVGEVTVVSSAGGVAKQTVVIQGPNVSGP